MNAGRSEPSGSNAPESIASMSTSSGGGDVQKGLPSCRPMVKAITPWSRQTRIAFTRESVLRSGSQMPVSGYAQSSISSPK